MIYRKRLKGIDFTRFLITEETLYNLNNHYYRPHATSFAMITAIGEKIGFSSATVHTPDVFLEDVIF